MRTRRMMRYSLSHSVIGRLASCFHLPRRGPMSILHEPDSPWLQDFISGLARRAAEGDKMENAMPDRV